MSYRVYQERSIQEDAYYLLALIESSLDPWICIQLPAPLRPHHSGHFQKIANLSRFIGERAFPTLSRLSICFEPSNCSVPDDLMLASSSLSVELWQAILRYAISVPDFLDPDAFEGILSRGVLTQPRTPVSDESVYWATERTRNQLRRVSKSWDAYLQPYEHRFVRFLDIHHETVDPAFLTKAARVSFSRYGCKCDLYCVTSRSLERFCWRTISAVESMDMEIADITGEDYLIGYLVQNLPKLQNLKTLIAPKCTYACSFTRLVERLPSLRHFHGKGFRGTLENRSDGKFTSHSLVTLAFDLRLGGKYDTLLWELPSLRYLRVSATKCKSSPDFVTVAVLHLLAAVGQQLRSFYLLHQPAKMETSSGIWELCPRLEIFRSSLLLVPPPPHDHPIHTIGVTHGKQLEDFTPLPEWPNLRRIIISRPWGQAGDEDWTRAFSNIRDDVKIQNGIGLTLEEFMEQRKMKQADDSDDLIELTAGVEPDEPGDAAPAGQAASQ